MVCSRRLSKQVSMVKPRVVTRSNSWPRDCRSVTTIKSSSHDAGKLATTTSGKDSKPEEATPTMNEWLTQLGSEGQPSGAAKLRAVQLVGRRHKSE